MPYFGLCLGMQIAVIEFVRNVLHLKGVNSAEFDVNCENPVIDLMIEQKGVIAKGGTMRLGAYQCNLREGSRAYDAYGKPVIHERHRHRYEFNNKYWDAIEKAGLIVSGVNPDRQLAEIMEVENHRWYLGVQFHPEFKSKPHCAHPLFSAFIKAAKESKILAEKR
jgi:CTP synthase